MIQTPWVSIFWRDKAAGSPQKSIQIPSNISIPFNPQKIHPENPPTSNPPKKKQKTWKSVQIHRNHHQKSSGNPAINPNITPIELIQKSSRNPPEIPQKPSGYDIHSSPWFFRHGPNRNRWFTWVQLAIKWLDFPWQTVNVMS